MLTFFDHLADRSFWALLQIWLGVVVGCGLLFWLLGLWRPALLGGGSAIRPDLDGLGTALYFSLVTATSVGYGDVTPVGAARVLAGAEAVAGLLLFGCLVSKFVSHRQEALTEEIHRTTFESRLGRVRTNLHLVLAELQGIQRICAEQLLPADRVQARVESATMVLIGELRSVHDLLYRPQQAPDEPVLEGLLVGVAAAMQELAELVRCLPARAEAASLRMRLGALAGLAREICGDCVPMTYAPMLRGWMDRIHGLALQLSA